MRFGRQYWSLITIRFHILPPLCIHRGIEGISICIDTNGSYTILKYSKIYSDTFSCCSPRALYIRGPLFVSFSWDIFKLLSNSFRAPSICVTLLNLFPYAHSSSTGVDVHHVFGIGSRENFDVFVDEEGIVELS